MNVTLALSMLNVARNLTELVGRWATIARQSGELTDDQLLTIQQEAARSDAAWQRAMQEARVELEDQP